MLSLFKSKKLLLAVGAIVVVALGWLVVSRPTTKPDTLGQQLPATVTPFLEKRVLDYVLVSGHNVMIVSALNNEFQRVSKKGDIMQAWPGDYYINPQFNWSPNQEKVTIIQRPVIPEPAIPIIVYDFSSGKTTTLSSDIISASWKSDQVLFAQKRNSSKTGGSLVFLDDQGTEKSTFGSYTQSLGNMEMFPADNQNIVIGFEPAKNSGKLHLIAKQNQDLQFETISQQATRPLVGPDKKQFLFAEIDARGKPTQTILYQLSQKKRQTLPFKTTTEKIVWLDSASLLAGVPKPSELAGEKLIHYTIATKKEQLITESTTGLPLQFNDLQSDTVNKNQKIVFFIDNDFLYKIEVTIPYEWLCHTSDFVIKIFGRKILTDQDIDEEQLDDHEPSFGEDPEEQDTGDDSSNRQRLGRKDVEDIARRVRGEKDVERGAQSVSRGLRSTGRPAGQAARTGGRAAAQGARAAAQATRAAAQAVAATARLAAQAVGALVSSGPIGWIILGIIILLIIIIIAVLIIFGYTYFAGGTTANYPHLADPVEAADNTDFLIDIGDPIGHWQQIINRSTLIKNSLEKTRSKALSEGKSDIVAKIDETTRLLDQLIQAAQLDKQDIDQVNRLKNPINKNLQELTPYLMTAALPVKNDQVIKKVLEHKNLAGDSNFKSDVKNGLVSTDLLKFLLIIGDNNFKIYVTATRSDHGKFVRKYGISTNRVSAHFYGKAVDLGLVNNQLVRPGATETAKLMAWIVDHQPILKAQNSARGSAGLFPRQVIGPKTLAQYAVNNNQLSPGFYYAGHEDHIHIGF